MRSAESDSSSAAARLNRDGFVWAWQLVDPAGLAELLAAADALQSGPAAGLRNVLRRSEVLAAFAASGKVRRLLSDLADRDVFAVRGILFDKTPEANWRVAWHQDVTVAVAERLEVPGFGPWSVKDEIVHVQPPVSVLEGMITIRLHLDDCDECNGALRVIPGSHAHGRLSADEIETWRTTRPVVGCIARAGDALVMRPLLLHSSSPAVAPRHRRILHVEFATGDLPGGLQWFDRIAA
jgi:ectoine hydroxylase-related dioxygenase (phytanoyl-CoA dioxygenase family)